MSERIIYVVSRWGEPSQTFVRREAAAVEALGREVAAASIKPPGSEGTDVPTLHLRPVEVAVAFAKVLLAHPGRVASTFGATLRAAKKPRNLVAHLAAAVVGIAWVGSGRLGPGHLHTHFGWVAATAAWAAARVDGRTYSVMLHAFEIHDERYHDDFTAVPLRDAVRVCTISERDRSIISERWGVDAGIVRISVDDAWLDMPSSSRRDDRLVVAIGRLIEKKGFEFLIEAMARVGSDWRCEIIGDGPLRAELQRRVDVVGLDGRVVLTGAMEGSQVKEALDRAAVFCLPSVEVRSGDRDGTPTVILEAMARGAAVVTTDAGAIPEQVGDAARIVGQRDPVALAAAIVDLEDATAREVLAARGRARVENGWTARRSAERLIDLIET